MLPQSSAELHRRLHGGGQHRTRALWGDAATSDAPNAPRALRVTFTLPKGKYGTNLIGFVEKPKHIPHIRGSQYISCACLQSLVLRRFVFYSHLWLSNVDSIHTVHIYIIFELVARPCLLVLPQVNRAEPGSLEQIKHGPSTVMHLSYSFSTDERMVVVVPDLTRTYCCVQIGRVWYLLQRRMSCQRVPSGNLT